jgi:hypothetical protein
MDLQIYDSAQPKFVVDKTLAGVLATRAEGRTAA